MPAAADATITLRELCEQCVRLFDVTVTRVVLTDGPTQAEFPTAGALRDTSPTRELMEDCPDGPYTQCMHTGRPVIVEDVAAREHAWPRFAARARNHGVTYTLAIPMRTCEGTYGVLVLLDTEGHPHTDEADLAQGLAQITMANVVQQREVQRTHTRVRQLQYALDSRITIEQAKGALAYRANITPDQAFTALRHYARAHNLILREVAHQILTDDTLARHLLQHSLRHQPET